MYPPKLIKKPFIWEVGHKFKVVTNIRQASVTDEIGIVCLELDGPRDEVNAAIKWLEKRGVNVEPVEIGVIESLSSAGILSARPLSHGRLTR